MLPNFLSKDSDLEKAELKVCSSVVSHQLLTFPLTVFGKQNKFQHSVEVWIMEQQLPLN